MLCSSFQLPHYVAGFRGKEFKPYTMFVAEVVEVENFKVPPVITSCDEDFFQVLIL